MVKKAYIKKEEYVIKENDKMDIPGAMGQEHIKDVKSSAGENCTEENCTGENCAKENHTEERKNEMGLFYDRDNLYSLMRTCGRYLYLRSGRGAGQGRILAILMNRKKMTQKELQDILRIQPGSISEILAKLEEKGLIQRSKDDEDKRRSILELTEAGAEAARLQEKQEGGHPTFGVLDEAEQEELKRMLGKLLEDWLGNQ